MNAEDDKWIKGTFRDTVVDLTAMRINVIQDTSSTEDIDY